MRIILLILMIIINKSSYADLFCGPKAVYCVCNHKNCLIEYDRIVSKCKVDSIRGTSLLNLYSISKDLGLNPIPERLKLKDLKKKNRIFIVHIFKNHYSVICNYDREGVYLEDYPYGIKYMKNDTFLKNWSGIAITYKSKKKNTYKNEYLKYNAIDIGTILSDEKKSFSIDLNNPNNGDIEIYSIRGSCGCIYANSDNRLIKKHKKTHININYVGIGKRRGLDREYIDIIIKNHKEQRQIIRFHVYAHISYPPVISQENIYFKKINMVQKKIIYISTDKNRSNRFVLIYKPNNINVTNSKINETENEIDYAIEVTSKYCSANDKISFKIDDDKYEIPIEYIDKNPIIVEPNYIMVKNNKINSEICLKSDENIVINNIIYNKKLYAIKKYKNKNNIIINIINISDNIQKSDSIIVKTNVKEISIPIIKF